MADELNSRRVKFAHKPKPMVMENLPPMFQSYIKRRGPLAIEKLQSALRQAKRIMGKASGAIGPPDVRKSTERTMIKKRKPGEFGGAGR